MKPLTLLLLVLPITVFAEEYATVVSVAEIKETRRIPYEVCNNVEVPVYGRSPSRGGVVGEVVDNTFGSTRGLVGAVVGGVIGSRIGKGSGRRLATVTGAVIGTKVGDGYDRKEMEIVGYRNEYKCDVVSKDETIISGYHAVYEYRGRMYGKVVSYPPLVGSRYPIDITIR